MIVLILMIKLYFFSTIKDFKIKTYFFQNPVASKDHMELSKISNKDADLDEVVNVVAVLFQVGLLHLKGLAMIFAGQENPLIIFRSKEIYIYFETNNKIHINFLLKLQRKTGFLASFILEGTLTVFLIS